MSSKTLPKLIHRKPLYIIGLNSGTSADGLDIARVKFSSGKLPELMECRTYSYPESLKNRIITYGEADFHNGEKWLSLDSELGITMGKLVRRFIRDCKVSNADLIGSHGQTIRHLPRGYGRPVTLQIGDPSHIARITGLPVISDFRRTDIAAGGEGAPMSPLLHQALFRIKSTGRAIVNMGGIANITLLPPANMPKRAIAGDSGPGNMAIDLAMRQLYGKSYDLDGRTARKGRADSEYVLKVLCAPYFQIKPPKSSGRELFGQKFFKSAMHAMGERSPEDIIATLSEITVASIAHFILRYGPRVTEIYLCGGGAKNRYFVNRLRDIFKGYVIESTAALGYDPDYLEALLWAYLAHCFINEQPVESGKFTGATQPYIPGKLCLP